VIAKGSNRDFPFFDTVVRSGPDGEHPRASGSVTGPTGRTYRLGATSCFVVSGHTATWSGRLAPNPDFRYGKATVRDGAGEVPDRFTAVAGNAPMGCKTPARGFDGKMRSGDIVVHDALPAPAAPYPAGSRRVDVSRQRLALTRFGTVRPRLTCLRSRRACRGHALVLTAGGRRSWTVSYLIAPGRRAAVAVGLHRDQIRRLRNRGELLARIVAVRERRVVGQAEAVLLGHR
jgi:hypothetical protein